MSPESQEWAVRELLCELATAAPRGASTSACSVVLQVDPVGSERTSHLVCASSDVFAAGATVMQHELGEGPERDVLAGAGRITVPDVAREVVRWPLLALTARGHALGAVHVEPLATADLGVFGLVSWYAKSSAEYAPEARAAHSAYATLITGTVALARRLLDGGFGSGELDAALHARRLISRALAILVESRCCDEREAFELLCADAEHNGAQLHTVAAVLVDRAGRDRPTAARTWIPTQSATF